MHPRTLHFKIPRSQKSDQYTKHKNQNIHHQIILPTDPGISKKSSHNKEHPQKHPCNPRSQEPPRSLKQHDHLKQRIKKNRKKQHFQMLPHRFIHRSKKRHKRIFHTPFISKMQKNSRSNRKKNSQKQVRAFSDSHSNLLIYFKIIKKERVNVTYLKLLYAE